jgi:hypothetical protein
MLVLDKLKPFPKVDIAHDEKSLSQWCRWWRDALGMSDWVLDVRFARLSELDGAYGRSSYKSSMKSANICLIANIDADDADHNFDIEQTLVHELLHCKLWHFNRDGAGEVESILEEQVIDTLAWSCVNLRRMHRG